MRKVQGCLAAWVAMLGPEGIQSLSTISPAPRAIGPTHTLILVRHGDSIWNGKAPGCQETFTGWTDVELSRIGEEEAVMTGQTLARQATGGIDALFTSTLTRAKMTAHHCFWAYYRERQDRAPKKFVMDARLNERHYGSLQGLVKEDAERGKFGHDAEDVRLWRRSWHVVPPLLAEDDPRRLHELKKYRHFCGGADGVPRGESLEMVAKERLAPFVSDVLTPALDAAFLNSVAATVARPTQAQHDQSPAGGTGLVVAHANSLRALIGVLCDVENDPKALSRLEALKIPTANPMVMRYRRTDQPGVYHAVRDIALLDDNVDGRSVQPSSKSALPVWPLSCVPMPALDTRETMRNLEAEVTASFQPLTSKEVAPVDC